MKQQESSSKIMSFLIQDLLDFAQIKAGKFRKNYQTFNLLDAIDQVMSIQASKAIQQDVELNVVYKNISIDNADGINTYSPLILSDE